MSYAEGVGLVESCRQCGQTVRRPDVDHGPAFCSFPCEQQWRRRVAGRDA